MEADQTKVEEKSVSKAQEGSKDKPTESENSHSTSSGTQQKELRVKPTISTKVTTDAQNYVRETNLLTNKVTRDVELAKSRCRTPEKRQKLDVVLLDFNTSRSKLVAQITSFTQFITDTTASNSWNAAPTAARRITHELRIEVAKQELTNQSHSVYTTIGVPESDPDFGPSIKELENLTLHRETEIYRLEYPPVPLPIGFYKNDVIKYLENALVCLEDETKMNHFAYKDFLNCLLSAVQSMRNFGGVVEIANSGGGAVLGKKLMELAEEMIKEARVLLILLNDWQLDPSDPRFEKLSACRDGWISIVISVTEVVQLLAE